MRFPKGIEGDYLETKNDNLFFDVKGIHHPSDRKICFIRFFPNSEGDRVKNGIKYKKIYNLRERFNFLKENYPKYLFFAEQLDMEMQGVNLKDIKKIYNPVEYYHDLLTRSNIEFLEERSKELCELFVENSTLPRDSIGITGSQMIGLNKTQSDIDLIIYGTENGLNFQTSLLKILTNNNYCRTYNQEEYLSHYQWRVGGSNIPYDKFLQSERRKLHQGMFKGFEFYIRYIKSPDDWQGGFYDYMFRNLGRITIEAKIIDATDKIFTPCCYKIEGLKLKKVHGISSKINLNDITEINSYRGRFCEQAVEGEVVLVEGKLEKVIFKNNKEYLRILLTDQVKDKMISLSQKTHKKYLKKY